VNSPTNKNQLQTAAFKQFAKELYATRTQTRESHSDVNKINFKHISQLSKWITKK